MPEMSTWARAALAAALVVPVLPAAPAGARSRPPAISARAAVVLDVAGRRVLYSRNADRRLPMASLAKMMTALVVSERLEPTDTVEISRRAARAEADAVRWPQGKTFTVDQVMHGMMMMSSNGAAVALAERVAGSVGRFTRLMNRRAGAFGASNSTFATPNGLDADGQYSTARDLALIAAAVLRDRWLTSITGSLSYAVRWPNGKLVFFRQTNKFVHQYEGAVGVKNGFTTDAGRCVAAAAVRDGRTVVAVVMHDLQVYDDAARLVSYGFSRLGGLPMPEAAPSPASAGSEAEAAALAGAIGASQEAAGASPAAGAPPAVAGERRGLPASTILIALLFVAYAARVGLVRRREARRRARTGRVSGSRRPDAARRPNRERQALPVRRRVEVPSRAVARR